MDDISNSQFVKNAVGSLVRWLLVLAAGVLVKKGIISDSQSAIYVEQYLPVAIGGALALVALLWSIYQKKRANAKVDLALALPANTTRETLEEKAA